MPNILRMTMFGGIIPRLAKRGLPDNAAQFAINANLYSGELRAWSALKTLKTGLAISNPATVYHYKIAGADRYKPFATYANVVKSALINDAFGRLYWTDANGPWINTLTRFESGFADFRLGVPAPAGSVTVTPTGGTAQNAETRVYLCTLITAWGEESGPGTAITASGNSDGTWTITGLNALTYDSVTYPNVTKLRLYRTLTSSTGVDYRQVNEWNIGARPASYVDNVTATDIADNTVMDSLLWTPPPTNLQGLVGVAGGFLCGFVGRTVRASVPYYPHAWPEDYQWAVEDDIVGLGSFGNVVVVLTTGRAFALIGPSPDAMSLQKMEAVQPCLSARGIVSTSQGVVYPTTEGLAVIDGSDTKARIITQAWVTKKEWMSKYAPALHKASVYKDRYLAFYGPQLGICIGFDDPLTGFTEIQTTQQISAVDIDQLTGQTLVTSGTTTYEWDGDDNFALSYLWRSKPFLLPKPCNFGAIQVRGDFSNNIQIPILPAIPATGFTMNDDDLNGPVNNTVSYGGSLNGPAQWQAKGTAPGGSAAPLPAVAVKLYCDGVLRWFANVESETPLPLPSDYKGSLFEIEIEGTSPVFSVTIADTRKSLENTP